MKKVILIVATDIKNGISKNGSIPWYNKEDLLRFKVLTTSCQEGKINCVIYGKKTFLDLPIRQRCLKDRHNIIISSTLTKEQVDKENYTKQSYSLFDNLEKSINFAQNNDIIDNIFICGGSQIYKEAIALGLVDIFQITVNHTDYNCDNFYPINLQKQYLDNQIYDLQITFREGYEFQEYIIKN